MRRPIAIVALLVAGATMPADAATVSVTVAGFQYTPSGWAAVDPFNLSAGAGTTETPAGSPHDAPSVRRGDTLSFANVDPVPHTVTKVSGSGSWAPVSLAGAGSGSLSIPANFPTGVYVYRCTIHQGMRGAFTVTA